MGILQQGSTTVDQVLLELLLDRLPAAMHLGDKGGTMAAPQHW